MISTLNPNQLQYVDRLQIPEATSTLTPDQMMAGSVVVAETYLGSFERRFDVQSFKAGVFAGVGSGMSPSEVAGTVAPEARLTDFLESYEYRRAFRDIVTRLEHDGLREGFARGLKEVERERSVEHWGSRLGDLLRVEFKPNYDRLLGANGLMLLRADGQNGNPTDAEQSTKIGASCAGMDTSIFYDSKLRGPGRPSLKPQEHSDKTLMALATCSGCPIRDDCYEDAMKRGEVYGVWGGTTPTQRLDIRRARRQARER